MAAFAAAPFRGHGLFSVVVSTTFGATNRLPSIVESRYAGDYIPKFQAKFGVAEEESDRPRLGLPQPPVSTPPPSPVPRPSGFPTWVVSEIRKAPSFEGASFIFGAGQKQRLQ